MRTEPYNISKHNIDEQKYWAAYDRGVLHGVAKCGLALFTAGCIVGAVCSFTLLGWFQ